MKRWGFCLLAFAFLGIYRLNAQNSYSTQTVEFQSYQYYINGNWDSLITYAKSALKNNIDYYYLRLRLGIAYYKEGKYRVATKHFLKALNFVADNDLAKEYLYFSNFFSEDYTHAKLWGSQLSQQTKNRLDTLKFPPFNYANAEVGIKSSANDSIGNFLLSSAGFTHKISKRYSLYHDYSYIRHETYWGNYYQQNYLLLCIFPFKNSWTLYPGFRVLNVNSEPFLVETAFSTSLWFKKSSSYFDFQAGAGASNLYSTWQIQPGATLSYYPFGNNKLSITGSTYMVSDSAKTSYSLKASASYRPHWRLHLFTNYYYGKAKNVMEENGVYFNNSIDLTDHKLTFMAEVFPHKKVGIYIVYQREYKTENFVGFDYYYNSAILGIKTFF